MHIDIIRKIAVAIIIIFAANMLTADVAKAEESLYCGEYISLPALEMKYDNSEKLSRLIECNTEIKSKRKVSGGVALSWNIIEGVNGYQIFRKALKEDKYIKIKTQRGHLCNSFEDNYMEEKRSYYRYKVRGYFRIDGKLYFTKFSRGISI